MRSDNEFRRRIRDIGTEKSSGEVSWRGTEAPAKGEEAEHGLVEEAGKTVREYVCTFITQIEKGVGQKLPTRCKLHLWVVRWAAICYSRYAAGKDGRKA